MAQIKTFAEGDDLSLFDAAFWTQLLDGALPRGASESIASWASYPGHGGVHRLGVVMGLTPGAEVILDGDADWRDRNVLAIALAVKPGHWTLSFAGPVYPGNPNDVLTRPVTGALSGPAISVGYTGAGLASGSGASGSGYQVLLDGATTAIVRMFADSSTGYLRLYRDGADSGAYAVSYFVLVLASEQLGQRSTPAANPSLTVVDGTQIEPHILNGFQDRSMLGQMRDDAGSGIACDCFPLGPKLDGELDFPDLWERTSSALLGSALRRQPVAGMPLRFFYATIANGAEDVLDDEHDWRDRLLWGSGRFSTSAIGTGDADEGSHNAATTWDSARYTGAGESGAIATDRYAMFLDAGNDLVIRARNTDGALVIRNETGSAQYVTGIIGASFQLGPRSV